MSKDSGPATDQPQPTSRQDLEVRMIAKAWRDPAYEAALLADPKAALQKELQTVDPSIELPDDLTVAVHPEDENTYHIVIPRNPAEIGTGGVSGEDMDAVSPQTVAIVVVGAVVSGGPTPVVVVSGPTTLTIQTVVSNVIGVTTMGVANVESGPGGVVTSVSTNVFDGPSPILGVTTATTVV